MRITDESIADFLCETPCTSHNAVDPSTISGWVSSSWSSTRNGAAEITEHLIHCSLLLVRNTTATQQAKMPTMAHPMDHQHGKFLLLVAECNGHGRCNNFALSCLESVQLLQRMSAQPQFALSCMMRNQSKRFLAQARRVCGAEGCSVGISRHMSVSIAVRRWDNEQVST